MAQPLTPTQLLSKLQDNGYGRGKSSPTAEGQERVLMEAIVEAIVSQEGKLKAQATALSRLHELVLDRTNRILSTIVKPDEILAAGKGREPLSMPEVVRVVARDQHEDFAERPRAAAAATGTWVQHAPGPIIPALPGGDSDELAEMTMDSDKG